MMTEWTVKLWENQEEGKFHSYTTKTEGALLAAAEALAYFALLQDHSIITLTSHLESQLDHSERPEDIGSQGSRDADRGTEGGIEGRRGAFTAVASPGRIELPASRLGGARSIHLSYGDVALLTA